MKRSWLWMGSAGAALVLVGGLTSNVDARPRPRYQAITLGTLGGESSSALAVNDRGWVAGVATTAGGAEHAFLWRPGDGGLTDLGDIGTPTDLNNRLQVITDRGVVWDHKTRTTTQVPFPFQVRWGKLSINDRGQVALFRDDGASWDVGVWTVRTGSWQSRRCVVVTLGCPSAEDAPSAINNRGQLVTVPPCSGCAARLWDPRRRVWTTVIEQSDDQPAALSDSGLLVGRDLSCVATPIDTVVVDLRRGTRRCVPVEPVDVNDRGVVLGRTAVFDLCTATLRSLPRPSSTAVSWLATAINDRGVVSGTYEDADGVTHAVIWKPRR